MFGDAVVARQRDRELTLRDGDAFFATRDASRIHHHASDAGALHRHAGCRATAVAPLLGRLDDTPLSLVPPRTEALNLLVTYASAIADALPLATPELQRLAVSHMHDLVAATIGATRDGTSDCGGTRHRRRAAASYHDRHQRASRSTAICPSPRSRGATTSHHGTFTSSSRTKASPFRRSCSASASRAHTGILSDPCLADRNISSVAFDVGFGDLSYFNRAFRRHYAATPTEIRQSAMKTDPPSGE